MTGEMFKPPNADKGADYWKGKVSAGGYRILGDESFLIRPNYPEHYEIRDELRKIGYKEAEVEPFDTYQGPYIDLKGINVGKEPYERGALSLKLSQISKSCQIRQGIEDEKSGEFFPGWTIDCGNRNKELFKNERGYQAGTKEEVLDFLKELKEKLI